MIELFQYPVFQALGWTLLHSLWQGLIIALLLKSVLHFIGKGDAVLRYNLSVSALILMFAVAAFTFSGLYQIPSSDPDNLIPVEIDLIAASSTHTAASGSTLASMIDWSDLNSYLFLGVLIWIAGIVFLLFRITLQFISGKQLVSESKIPTEGDWQSYLDRLASKLPIGRPIKLLISSRIKIPCTLGHFKPVIILPASMLSGFSYQQVELILLHELAHIKRNDYLINIFQSVLETLFFFNPFIRMISKDIRLERENCCDDLVLASHQPIDYSETLTKLGEYNIYQNALAMRSMQNKNQLLTRIKRIMETNRKKSNTLIKSLTLLVLIAGMALISWITPGSDNQEPQNMTANLTMKPIVISGNLPFLMADTNKNRYIIIYDGKDSIELDSDLSAEELKKIFDEVKESMKEAEIDMQEALEDMKSEMMNEEDMNDAREALKEAQEEMKENMMNKEEMNEIMKEAREAFMEAKEEMQLEMMDKEEMNEIMKDAKEVFEDAKEEMKEAMEEFKEEMKDADMKDRLSEIEFDQEKFMKESTKAMKMAEKHMEEAMKNIDFESFEFDMEEIMSQTEIALRIAESHVGELMVSLDADGVFDMDMSQFKEQMESAMMDMEISLMESAAEMQKSEETLNQLETYLGEELIKISTIEDELLKDRLIQDNGEYTFEISKSGMKVNGKKINESLFNKYLELTGNPEKKISIKKKGDNLSISE